ncbi:MAG TPA: AgmX/PglI C-terminal domain-containing protein, partial [Anaeromyxobacteraceae bacterium]|nr:AgmX/PglI C-terminal domain-containing protein [Anaeromyxobacteraceae bacterium]
APLPAGEARPEPRREPPRKRTPRHERQVAAVEAAPRQEAERPEPPKAEAPRTPAAEAQARKAEPPPAAPVRTELTSAEVGASIRASAKAFDACVAEAARNEPNLQVVGRRVGLYITVNPSGVATGPHIDDAQVDESVLGACLKATARKMVFPAFQGEAFQVRIPMVLGGGK